MKIEYYPLVRIDPKLAKSLKLAKLAIKETIVADPVRQISSEIDQEIMKDLFGASNAVSSL